MPKRSGKQLPPDPSTAFAGDAWRCVEAQSRSALSRLTDSNREQQLLEQLLDESLPPVADAAISDDLILAPFRYLKAHGASRFGRQGQRGVWYGASRRNAAVCEFMHYRQQRFFKAYEGLKPREHHVTLLQARFHAQHYIDTRAAVFESQRSQIENPHSYHDCHALLDHYPHADVFAYRSLRYPPEHGSAVCYAIRQASVFRATALKQTAAASVSIDTHGFVVNSPGHSPQQFVWQNYQDE